MSKIRLVPSSYCTCTRRGESGGCSFPGNDESKIPSGSHLTPTALRCGQPKVARLDEIVCDMKEIEYLLESPATPVSRA